MQHTNLLEPGINIGEANVRPLPVFQASPRVAQSEICPGEASGTTESFKTNTSGAASAAVAKLMKVEATDTGHLSPAHLGKIVSLEEGHLITESDALEKCTTACMVLRN